MAITVSIVEKEKRDEKRQIVYMLIKVNGTEYEFSVGNVPIGLTKDEDILNWLKRHKEKYRELIQNRIQQDGEWAYKFPKWVKAIAEIEAIQNIDDVKTFLKKLVRDIGK